MAIADLQRRDTEVGRIRLGKKTATGRADKLDTFRFTSGDQAMIEEIAALYGGKAVPWQNEKKRQFEVITEAAVIPVYIPPQIVDPWYESWGSGVCQRRCDGIRDTIHDQPCDCVTDARGKKSKCKPTTRVNLHLAEIPGLGVWRLESHGFYAAGEMVQLSDRIQGIRMPLPARLALEQRGRRYFNRENGKVETLDYPVPVLWLDSITARHVALGEDAVSQVVRAAAAQQLGTSAPPAIETTSAPAIEAPKRPAEPDPQMVRRALAMITTATLDRMDDVHARIVKVGSPQVLIDAYRARLGELAEQAKADAIERERGQEQRPPLVLDGDDDGFAGAGQEFAGAWDPDEAADERRQAQSASAAAPAAPPAATEPPARTEAPPAAARAPEATGGTSGDRQAAMTRLLGVAGTKGIKRAELDTRMQSDHEVTLKAATAAQLDALAAAIG